MGGQSGAGGGRWRLTLLLTMLLLSAPATSRGGAELRIACASNFYPTLQRLALLFQNRHPEAHLELISGASGQLYQQIRHGAPYHLFLSADRAYPAALHRDHYGDEPRIYALGRLALWDPRGVGLNVGRPLTVAIANPATAPYGRAAEAVLDRYRDQQPALRWRAVVAANVSQATQLVDSGNADLGLVALSLVQDRRGEYRPIPVDWYRPLVQQGMVLDTGNHQAKAFMAFLLSGQAGRVIRADGYALPGGDDAVAR